ncbi:unnamed protein product [Litomosoides sigmodontis]|uniref:F-box domain-containing protein n=1 Tax=Litomosoides sigmodontis TaxID=42156 RepID=A0A3P7K5J1_LITSI|nr:unnamed protein product [Litomosoides sigmodontis]
MELRSDTIHFHTLHAQTEPIKNYTEYTILWLSELKNMTVAQTLPKLKTSKKIVKKSVVERKTTDTEADDKTTAVKTLKNSNGQKTVRKKIATSTVTVPPTTIPRKDDDDAKSGSDCVVVVVNTKKTVTSKTRNLVSNNTNGANYVNGDGSADSGTSLVDCFADSGISLVDSDTEKSSKCTNGNELDEQERIPSIVQQSESVTTSKTSPETAVVGNNTPIYHNDLPSPLTVRRNNIKYEMDKKVGRIVEEEEKEKAEDCDTVCSGVELTSNNRNMPDRCKKARDPLIPAKHPTSTHNTTFPRSILSNGLDSLQRLPAKDEISVARRFASEEIPPVQVLQLVLRKFCYRELGELRQVHPHWDELCGQALNSGYHELIKQTDKLLTDCQRRVHYEPDLHDVLSILTSVQVHILNPVDILRPAMDEGVCCFPYGELLDQTFEIVKKAKEMIGSKRGITINWKPVAELARRAQLHYKFNLAAMMEEKLGEVIRLKALQSIQRIDSFMIDSTVNKLEKATSMARDELEWEIEQLRHQNAQLKKDNRELKKDCMRLEARVEIIENKFKTMARLLQ